VRDDRAAVDRRAAALHDGMVADDAQLRRLDDGSLV
jgi:hypothetical protein